MTPAGSVGLVFMNSNQALKTTDLFKVQPLENPRVDSIELDDNVIAGKSWRTPRLPRTQLATRLKMTISSHSRSP